MTRYLLKYLYGKSWFLTRYIFRNKNIYPNGAVRILVYHNIPYAKINQFRSQILFVKEHFGFLNPADCELFLLGKRKFCGVRVLITFDDGFISQLYATKEVLDPLGIKAIFFVPVNFIGLRSISEVRQFVTGNLRLKRLFKELFPMDWDDLNRLAKNGHVIGSHTLNHPLLSKIRDEYILKDEICKSADTIEEKLGIRVKWFAYPNGEKNDINYLGYKIAKKRYTYSVTTIRGFNTPNIDRGCIHRDSIRTQISLDVIWLILEGGLDFLHRRKYFSLKNSFKIFEK